MPPCQRRPSIQTKMVVIMPALLAPVPYLVMTDQEDGLTSVPTLVPIMGGLASMVSMILFEGDPALAVIGGLNPLREGLV